MTCQCGQLFPHCPVDMKQVFWRRIRKISSDQSSGSNSHIHHFFLISFWNSKLAIFKSQYFYINIPPTSRVHVFLLPRFFQPPISQKTRPSFTSLAPRLVLRRLGSGLLVPGRPVENTGTHRAKNKQTKTWIKLASKESTNPVNKLRNDQPKIIESTHCKNQDPGRFSWSL